MKNNYKIVCLFLVMAHIDSFGRTVGSDTAVSREPQASFSASDTNNLILGFAQMENGIFFESANLSCAVDVLFPMSGNFVFNNNGTLTLNNNIEFEGFLNLSSGVINGNSYSINFPMDQNLVELPSVLYNRVIDEQASVSIASTRFLSWSFDNQYLATVHNGTNTQRLRIYSYNGSNLTLLTTWTYAANDRPQYVSWHPSEYYIVSSRFNSIDLFSFDPNANSLALTDQQTVTVRYPCPWSPDGNYVLFQGGTSINIFEINSGVIGTTLTVPIQNNRFPAYLDSTCWSSDGIHFAIGVYSFQGNPLIRSHLQVYAFNGSAITYQAEVDAIDFAYSLGVAWQPNKKVIVTSASFLFGGTPPNYWKIFNYDESNNSLSEISNAITPEQVSIAAVHWSSSGKYLSSLRNSGVDLQIFTYNEEKKKLEIVAGFQLNQATVFGWSPNEEHFGLASASIVTPFNFEKRRLLFQDANLTFASDTVFTTTVQFEGECSIDANNHEIDLSQGFIQLSDNATLNIKNAIINGVQNNNIFCSNNAGVLNLKKIELNLLNDYIFATGAFNIQSKFKVNSNENSFIYSSSQSSKVQEDSEIILGVNTRFSYAPLIANKGLFQLESDSSVLTLEPGSTLHSTSTGLRFESGIIRVSGSSAVKNDGTVEAESIDLSAVVLEWLTGGVLSVEGQVKI